MSCDSVPRPGRGGSESSPTDFGRARVGDVEDLDRGLDRGDQVRVGVVEVVAARVDRLVVRALADLDEADGLGVQRVGDVGDERAVLARPVLLEHVEAERLRLAVARGRAVAERVGGVADEGPARLVGLVEDLDVALRDAAVVGRHDLRVARVGDVHDLHAVLVGAREGVLLARQRRELDVGAVVRRAAVVDGVRQVLDVAHVGAVLVALLGARGAGRARAARVSAMRVLLMRAPTHRDEKLALRR